MHCGQGDVRALGPSVREHSVLISHSRASSLVGGPPKASIAVGVAEEHNGPETHPIPQRGRTGERGFPVLERTLSVSVLSGALRGDYIPTVRYNSPTIKSSHLLCPYVIIFYLYLF